MNCSTIWGKMVRDYKKINFILLIITTLLFSACSSCPINLSTAKEEIINYYESGKFDKELNHTIDNAIDKFKDVHTSDSDAVIFDIDETALSNYEINKQLDFGYVPALWDKWIQDEKAHANGSVKNLYDFLVSKNFRIIFISGRKDYQFKATYKNLKDAGYTKFDTLIVRKPDENNLTALEYKSKKRVELTEKGYKIVGDVGDQYSDLDGPDHGIQVKIPNYMYIIK